VANLGQAARHVHLARWTARNLLPLPRFLEYHDLFWILTCGTDCSNVDLRPPRNCNSSARVAVLSRLRDSGGSHLHKLPARIGPVQGVRGRIESSGRTTGQYGTRQEDEHSSGMDLPRTGGSVPLQSRTRLTSPISTSWSTQAEN
jgi:hypothetical protein